MSRAVSAATTMQERLTKSVLDLRSAVSSLQARARSQEIRLAELTEQCQGQMVWPSSAPDATARRHLASLEELARRCEARLEIVERNQAMGSRSVNHAVADPSEDTQTVDVHMLGSIEDSLRRFQERQHGFDLQVGGVIASVRACGEEQERLAKQAIDHEAWMNSCMAEMAQSCKKHGTAESVEQLEAQLSELRIAQAHCLGEVSKQCTSTKSMLMSAVADEVRAEHACLKSELAEFNQRTLAAAETAKSAGAASWENHEKRIRHELHETFQAVRSAGSRIDRDVATVSRLAQQVEGALQQIRVDEADAVGRLARCAEDAVLKVKTACEEVGPRAPSGVEAEVVSLRRLVGACEQRLDEAVVLVRQELACVEQLCTEAFDSQCEYGSGAVADSGRLREDGMGNSSADAGRGEPRLTLSSLQAEVNERVSTLRSDLHSAISDVQCALNHRIKLLEERRDSREAWCKAVDHKLEHVFQHLNSEKRRSVPTISLGPSGGRRSDGPREPTLSCGPMIPDAASKVCRVRGRDSPCSRGGPAALGTPGGPGGAPARSASAGVASSRLFSPHSAHRAQQTPRVQEPTPDQSPVRNSRRRADYSVIE